jgi:hypothetical protein
MIRRLGHTQTLVAIIGLILLASACQEVSSYPGPLDEVINAYREEQGLPPLAVSESLTRVAEAHVRDLEEQDAVHGSCNLHSWSDQGTWSDCCYTDDHAEAQCMWDKPRELTDYPGDGYEIAAMSSGITANEALDLWRSSEGHHGVILNRGIWADVSWRAMGAAVSESYAVVWFGKEDEP